MKKLVLVLALMLLLGAMASAQRFAHLNRYAAANAALPKVCCGPRVVLMGDSITDVWAERRPGFFEENGFIGRGISGEETSQMLLRFRQDVIDIDASVVVILAGINDIAYNLGDPYIEDLTYSNIISMVELSWANGIRPVVCGVLPSYNLRWRKEVTDVFEKVCSLNARLKAFCTRHGVTYIDYGTVLAGENGKIKEGLSEDTVHPTEAGYVLMEKYLLENLK